MRSPGILASRLSLLALALVTTSATVAAQDASSLAGRPRGGAALEGVDQRLATRFPTSVALRIDALVDSAAAEGLPTEPLVLRALEGGAKGVAADRIQAALARLHASLRRARDVLGISTTPGDLTTAATALQTGLEPARLVELRNLRGTRSLTVPLGSYLDLVAQGAVSERAWLRVMELARRQATDREYERIDPASLVARQPEDRR
jgi:hypothetical protein